MKIHLRTTALIALFGAMSLVAVACGGDESSSGSAATDAASGDGITVDVDGDAGTMSIGGSELPEGFPSEMPIYDESLSPISAMSLDDEDDGEQRVTATFQPDATEDELLEFYERELPANGWTIGESDQQTWEDDGEVPFSGVIIVDGHGYTGGITIMEAGGVMSLSYSFSRPLG